MDTNKEIEKLNNMLRRNITYISEHRNQIKKWIKELEKSEDDKSMKDLGENVIANMTEELHKFKGLGDSCISMLNASNAFKTGTGDINKVDGLLKDNKNHPKVDLYVIDLADQGIKISDDYEDGIKPVKALLSIVFEDKKRDDGRFAMNIRTESVAYLMEDGLFRMTE